MCQRCQKRMFAPRAGTFTFAMEWRYRSSKKELEVEMRRLQDLADDSVVTHIHCESPSVDGFVARMKGRLKMPLKTTHPLLF